MLSLPNTFTAVISIFVPVFSRPVWQHAKLLLVGAILAPGKRTVSSILRIMGIADEPHFQTYHRVLNRAAWSPLKASRFLLRFMLAMLIPWWQTLVVGLDDTEEGPAKIDDEQLGRAWRVRADDLTAQGP